jgi:hypothetical protein
MKLREFNAENTISVRTGKPVVHINGKTGLLNFHKSACDLIGLSANKQIVFHQNEEYTESWYVEVVKETGFAVRDKDRSKALMFNNTVLARSIFESVGFAGVSGRILVSSEFETISKRKLYPLITASLKVIKE